MENAADPSLRGSRVTIVETPGPRPRRNQRSAARGTRVAIPAENEDQIRADRRAAVKVAVPEEAAADLDLDQRDAVDNLPALPSRGAEVLGAQLAEQGLMTLLAPVKRVAGYDTVMPLYRLEHLYLPSTERIVNAVNEVMEFA